MRKLGDIMNKCPICKEYLMNDGLTFNEGISAALIGDPSKPRAHKCQPEWEVLIGEDTIRPDWASNARNVFALSVDAAARKAIEEWNEGDGEYSMIDSRTGGSSGMVPMLIRRNNVPDVVFAVDAEAEPSIHYRILNERKL